MGKAEDLEEQSGGLGAEGGEDWSKLLKKERINGKVLAVTEYAIEIEGYGRLELAPNFNVYKLYGDFNPEI
ncbi:MAG: hypothetical protein V8R91_11180 [Butyricimonas faecihominis]